MEQQSLDMTKRSHQIMGIIIGLAFTILAIVASYSLAFKPVSKIAEAQNWDKTICTIESMDYKETHPDHGAEMVVRYTYEYDGKKYWSSNYRYGKATYSKGMIFQPGQQADCFVNPDNPEEAVMIRDDSVWSLWALLSISFIFLGIFAIFKAIRYMIYYTKS
ncbi:MAG: DUF3592 domain-containing protein [Planctomycetota bacterium]|jgi:hypothetical protein